MTEPIHGLGTVLLALALVVSSCGGSDTDPVDDSSTTEVTTAGSTDSPSATPTDSVLYELIGTEAFAGGNDEVSIADAVAAFNDAGADFSPDALASTIPEDCSGIDAQAIGEIFGIPVSIEEFEGGGFVELVPGYLNCAMRSAENADVPLGSIYLAPDENGRENWVVIGTMEGARAIDGLADRAIWNDGSNGTNVTNMSRLQLEVTQGGTQSFITLQNNDLQRDLVGEWTVPQMVLALAVAAESLTT